MVDLNDDTKRTLAAVQVVEILRADQDGHYSNPMAVEELCSHLCQYPDNDVRDLIDTIAQDPGAPVEYDTDAEVGVILQSERQAKIYYKDLRDELPFY